MTLANLKRDLTVAVRSCTKRTGKAIFPKILLVSLGMLGSLMTGNAAEVVPGSDTAGRVPALVSQPIPQPSRPVRLSEPIPRFWLPLGAEPRIHPLLSRSTPTVRPLPEPLFLAWGQVEPMPAREPLPAGPKVAAPYPAPHPGQPPILVTHPATASPGPAVLEMLFTSYLQRAINHWRDQPASNDSPVIPDPERELRAVRLRKAIPESPFLPPVPMQPPRPVLPVSEKR